MVGHAEPAVAMLGKRGKAGKVGKVCSLIPRTHFNFGRSNMPNYFTSRQRAGKTFPSFPGFPVFATTSHQATS